MVNITYFNYSCCIVWYKKLRNVGADLGAAMKSFKKSSKEDTPSNTIN
jgi:Sec-independent protein translocase protein TatA